MSDSHGGPWSGGWADSGEMTAEMVKTATE